MQHRMRVKTTAHALGPRQSMCASCRLTRHRRSVSKSMGESVRMFSAGNTAHAVVPPVPVPKEAKTAYNVDVESLAMRLKQPAGPSATARARSATVAAKTGSRTDRADTNGESRLTEAEEDQVAAALHQQLEHTLKFRDQKNVKQNGDKNSARRATEARTKHEPSDGAAPLGVADEESSLQCRLFHQVTERHLTVNFESEFSQMQQEQLIRAGSEGQALQRSKKGTFDDLTEAILPEIAVDGATVLAYASLAARTAAKRIRPISKQVNLGPRKVIRCGWGGQGPGPLESLAKQQRAKAIFENLLQ